MIRRFAVAAVVIGAVAVAGGLVAAHRTGPLGPTAAVPAPNVGTLPADSDSDSDSDSTTNVAGRPVRHALTMVSGARLELPRLGVDAPITGVRLAGSVMQVPHDPRVVGWWRAGAAPGAGRGSVVVVGHVNYAGTAGAFAALPRARPGDPVAVEAPDGERAYRVSAVRTYAKTSGIPDAAFASGGAERLVLVTCGGPFDARTGNYVDNVVVYAVPV